MTGDKIFLSRVTFQVVSAKLKAPEMKERKFEEVVKSAEQAAVLVLVY